MINIPVLKRNDSFIEQYKKLKEERMEVDELLVQRIVLMKPDNNIELSDIAHESFKSRLNLIGELMDEIQCCINLLDKVGATPGEINGHIYKLEKRGWKFKKVLKIEGE